MPDKEIVDVMFESIPLTVGDFGTGLDADGNRIIVKVISCKWYVRPISLLCLLLPMFLRGPIMMKALSSGLDLQYENTYSRA